MDIHLHIERLVLEGMPLTGPQGRRLQAAVETELARLLTENGLAPGLQTGGALPGLPASAIQLTAESTPAQMGRQIARSVYSGMGNPGLASNPAARSNQKE